MLVAIQFIAALVVLAEALNKLERTDLFGSRHVGLSARLRAGAWLLRPWAWRRARVVDVVKAAGWAALAVGAFMSLLTYPDVPHVLVITGFALLIVRSRLREGVTS